MIGRLGQLLRSPLDHPFLSVVVLYVGIVVFLWRCGWPNRAPDRDYVASRELVNNHRIVSGDLRRPDGLATSLGFYMAPKGSIEGKYLRSKQPIMPGQSLNTLALADKPDMQLPDETHAVVFPLPSDSRLIGLLDVGSPVVLLGQDPDSKAAVAIYATVHAILCESTNSDTKGCFPILRIPTDQTQFVTKNLGALRLALGLGPTPPPPTARPPPLAATPSATRVYLVFFDWGDHHISPERMQIIELAAHQYRSGTLQVTGYADLSGSAQYNQCLSEQRANAVAAALESRGVPAKGIVVTSRGMNDPRVSTLVGRRELQNRRVEIVFP
jgi:outer membrane protein OmpA-like peptidoglycan-associated protein